MATLPGPENLYLIGTLFLASIMAIVAAVIAYIVVKVIVDNQRNTVNMLFGPVPPPGINIETKEIPLPEGASPEEALAKIEASLRRMAIPSVRQGDSLLVEGMAPWLVKAVVVEGRPSLRIGSFVKDWVVVLTIFLLLLFAVFGVLLGAYVFWTYMKTKDALRLALQEIVGPEAWRYL